MVCKNCGFQTSISDAFCPNCGAAAEQMNVGADNSTQQYQGDFYASKAYDGSVSVGYDMTSVPPANPKGGKLKLILLIVMAVVIVAEAVVILIMSLGGNSREIAVPDSVDSKLVGTWEVSEIYAEGDSDGIGGEVFIEIDSDGNIDLILNDRHASRLYKDFIKDYASIACGTNGDKLSLMVQAEGGDYAVKATCNYSVKGDTLSLTIPDSLVDILDSAYSDLNKNFNYEQYGLSSYDMRDFSELIDILATGGLVLVRA